MGGKGSEVDAVVGALGAFEALANECILVAEAHLINALPVILNGSGSKQARIRAAAESAALAITSKMSPNCVREVLPALFEASKSGVAWQTRTLSLKIIASFSDHAPFQLGFSLPDVRIVPFPFFVYESASFISYCVRV